MPGGAALSRRRADALLLTASATWGITFVVTKVALGPLSPMIFMAARFGIATVLLLPLLRHATRAALAAGALVGLVLAGGTAAQTLGLVYTTPSRSAFITGLSSVLAPFVGWLLLKHRLHIYTVGGVVLAGLGLYFLTSPNTGGLNRGDLITLICAVLFAFQIVLITHYSRRYDLRVLLIAQVGMVGAAAATTAGCCEQVRWELSTTTIAALLFVGVIATAAAFWAQLVAQRAMSTMRAALILALEPAFASVAAWLWLGELLSGLQWLGGSLIVAGMVIADWEK